MNKRTKKLIAITLSQTLAFGVLPIFNSAYAVGGEGKLDNNHMTTVFEYINSRREALLFPFISKKCNTAAHTLKINPFSVEKMTEKEKQKSIAMIGSKETVDIPISRLAERNECYDDLKLYDSSQVKYSKIELKDLKNILCFQGDINTDLILRVPESAIDAEGKKVHRVHVVIKKPSRTEFYYIDFEDAGFFTNLVKEMSKFKELGSIKVIVEHLLTGFDGRDGIGLMPYFIVPYRVTRDKAVKQVKYTGFGSETASTLSKLSNFSKRAEMFIHYKLLKEMKVEIINPLHLRVTLEPIDERGPKEVFDISSDSVSLRGFLNFAYQVYNLRKRVQESGAKLEIVMPKHPELFPETLDKDDPLSYIVSEGEDWGFPGVSLNKFYKKYAKSMRKKTYEYIFAFPEKKTDSVTLKLGKVKPGESVKHKLLKLNKNSVKTDSRTLSIRGDIGSIATGAFDQCPNLEVIDFSKARIGTIKNAIIGTHTEIVKDASGKEIIKTVSNCPKLRKIILGPFDSIEKNGDPFVGFGQDFKICVKSLDYANPFLFSDPLEASSRFKENAFKNHTLEIDLSENDRHMVDCFSGYYLKDNIGLKKVKFPSATEEQHTVRDFSNCDLKEVDLSNTSISGVYRKAFAGNVNLKKVKFPKCINIIREEAFKDCDITGELDFSDTNLKQIYFGAFSGNHNITRVILPDDMQLIVGNAFEANVKFVYRGKEYSTFNELSGAMKLMK